MESPRRATRVGPIGERGASMNATDAANRAGAIAERLARVREHLRRYRDLASQGKWADAGKELEAIESEVQK